jgi:hypothetical protein
MTTLSGESSSVNSVKPKCSFPSAPFWHWLSGLSEAGVFDEAWSS